MSKRRTPNEAFSSVWYTNWQELVADNEMYTGDIISMDRGVYEHYCVVVEEDDDDFSCFDFSGNGDRFNPTTQSWIRQWIPTFNFMARKDLTSSNVVRRLLSEIAINNDGSKCKVRIHNEFPKAPKFLSRLYQVETNTLRIPYSLTDFNCEHMANYLRSNKQHSHQITPITKKILDFLVSLSNTINQSTNGKKAQGKSLIQSLQSFNQSTNSNKVKDHS